MTERKTHTVRMFWMSHDDIEMWNERMAWVTENFGLPGDRWTSHAKEDWIDVHFYNEEDAVMFKLKFGQYCVE